MNPTTDHDNQHLVRELRRFDSIRELFKSDFYQNNRAELRALLNEPRIYEFDGAAPRLKSFLRVVQWNIEYGIRLDGIVDALTNHPLLRFADVILLNEVDDGMWRSGNANVARELSERLLAHVIYGIEYLEMGTSGPGQAARHGENTVALHGNAILTRHPFRDPKIIRLPRCENNFASAQKRLGGRLGLTLDIEPAAGVAMTVAAVHLDVVNRPRCRRNQIHALLEAIEARLSGGRRCALVAGDLNTHTFVRGGRIRAFGNLIRVLAADQQRLATELLHPEEQEPALRELATFGYDLERFNDRLPTQRMGGDALGDASGLPDIVRRLALKRLGPAGLMLQFRLDWIAARGLSPLRAGECVDEPTGEASAPPQTITGLTHQGRSLSDHDPIVADISFTSPSRTHGQESIPARSVDSPIEVWGGPAASEHAPALAVSTAEVASAQEVSTEEEAASTAEVVSTEEAASTEVVASTGEAAHAVGAGDNSHDVTGLVTSNVLHVMFDRSWS